jgi:hypothetical protein
MHGSEARTKIAVTLEAAEAAARQSIVKLTRHVMSALGLRLAAGSGVILPEAPELTTGHSDMRRTPVRGAVA